MTWRAKKKEKEKEEEEEEEEFRIVKDGTISSPSKRVDEYLMSRERSLVDQTLGQSPTSSIRRNPQEKFASFPLCRPLTRTFTRVYATCA